MSQGFVGGVAVAAAISAVEHRDRQFLTTYFGRNLNHRRPYWKLFGLARPPSSASGLCLAFNLGVAHLRDALEAGLPLEEALAKSWQTALGDAPSRSTASSPRC